MTDDPAPESRPSACGSLAPWAFHIRESESAHDQAPYDEVDPASALSKVV
jgi:hypothetical protein